LDGRAVVVVRYVGAWLECEREREAEKGENRCEGCALFSRSFATLGDARTRTRHRPGGDADADEDEDGLRLCLGLCLRLAARQR
jgi:hypothetical protein